MHSLEQIDRWLFLLINSHLTHPWLDPFFVVITQKTTWIVPGLIAAGIFTYFHRKNALGAIGLALITVALSDQLCCSVLKPFFGRLRPCHPKDLVEGGRFLLGFKKSLSLPSAHAMNMFAQAGLWSFLFPSQARWFVGFAALIAYSRVYVGVHYPGDVLLGAVLGFVVGMGVYWSYVGTKELWKRLVEKRRSAQGVTDDPTK